MSSIYESNVDPLRPNDAHGISLQLIGRDKMVLELGAAAGHVTRALKSRGNSVVAIERDGRFAEQLAGIADRVHITDLDWLDLNKILGDEKFDVILAGDVLEHCTRPDLVLLQCHSLLSPDGFIVMSLPNVAHADVRLSLLTGRFEYRPTGLLDNTHLRFFTRRTIEKFVEENGFSIEEIFASTAPLGGTEIGPPDSSIPREAIEFVQRDRDSTVYQYVMRLRANSEPPRFDPPTKSASETEKLLAELSLSQEALSFAKSQFSGAASEAAAEAQLVQVELEAVRTEAEVARTEAEVARTEAEVTKTELFVIREKLHATQAELEVLQSGNEELRMSLLHARDAVIGTSAELGTMRARYECAQAQVDSLVNQLNILHTSRTWRIGRFMLLPLRGVRWVIRKFLG
jgi:2-polyprenyl-3-methyl-5-hydroxy-6-metoxy-1,4-benzoquinol methylase